MALDTAKTTIRKLIISAPGSIMITGEHAVVYGHPAIVCAIDQRITIVFKARKDRQVRVTSEITEATEITIEDARAEGPLRFVFGAVERLAAELPHGFDIEIKSDINPTLGLGSSAAVTVAMFAGLLKFIGADDLEPPKIHQLALELVRKIQGRGSGADLAASAFGGLSHYQIATEDTSAKVERLPDPGPMSLCYSGYKTPTGVVLEKIASEMRTNPAHYQTLYARMGDVAQKTIDAARQTDWPTFHQSIDAYQHLMAELGVSDDKLDELIVAARKHAGVKSAKISGSGLGDCIVAFGDCPPTHTPAILAIDSVRIEAIG